MEKISFAVATCLFLPCVTHAVQDVHQNEQLTNEVVNEQQIQKEKERKQQERTNRLQAEINAIKSEYSNAELLAALSLEEKESNSGLHGTLGTGFEIEGDRRTDNFHGGKVKFNIAQGNFRHDSLPGWEFGFYSGREQFYTGSVEHGNFTANDPYMNSIQEVYANRTYNLDRGAIGWGIKLGGESADDRTVPEGKIFGSYNLTDAIDFHGYAMYHVEIKQDRGDFYYYELEPGFGFKLTEDTGAWMNFRYQVGNWRPNSGRKETELEWIIKPGIWHRINNELTLSLWGEFGQFNKEDTNTNDKIWKESYQKYGISANYLLTKTWTIFGEVSYKRVLYTDYDGGNRFDGYLPLIAAGVNYSF